MIVYDVAGNIKRLGRMSSDLMAVAAGASHMCRATTLMYGNVYTGSVLE